MLKELHSIKSLSLTFPWGSETSCGIEWYFHAPRQMDDESISHRTVSTRAAKQCKRKKYQWDNLHVLQNILPDKKPLSWRRQYQALEQLLAQHEWKHFVSEELKVWYLAPTHTHTAAANFKSNKTERPHTDGTILHTSLPRKWLGAYQACQMPVNTCPVL